ncbi:MAG: NAD-dependent epimerase/dehydratase family protein, partial [Legionella sp.]
MAKILITGATGFVGRSLIPSLTLAGHTVRCAVTRRVAWIHEEQIVVGRLEQYIDWSDALEDIDIVIHLAARVHVMKDNSESPSELYSKVNTIATQNLAEQAAALKISRFIYLSSIKVNGEFTVTGKPFTEACSTHPDDPYGLSKLNAEHALLAISQKTEMEVVILRPPLIYGPGVKANFLKMLGLV